MRNEPRPSGSPDSLPCSSLAVQAELLLSSRVVTEVVPVTGLNCQLLLGLSFAHALLDTMVDTRSVSHDQDGPGYASASAIAFNSLSVISTHGDLSYVYIAVRHCDACKIFLLGLFTASCELSYSTSLGSLWRTDRRCWSKPRYRIP